MFSNLRWGQMTKAQRVNINQENEGIQLTNSKGVMLNQPRVPGLSKQVFGDVKNRLDARSTTSAVFQNSKNTPFHNSKKPKEQKFVKPHKIQFDEDFMPKSSPYTSSTKKPTTLHGIQTNKDFFSFDAENKRLVVNEPHGLGSTKQVFDNQDNKLDAKSELQQSLKTTYKGTKYQELLRPHKIEFDEDLVPKHIIQHTDSKETSLDIESLLDAFPIPKPKPDNYGYTSNLFDFTDDEINDVMFQKIDEYQESPKLYNDDFKLREIPMPVYDDLSISDDLPLCMNSLWETGNNSILGLFDNDNSYNSFGSYTTDAMDEEDEMPDMFTFKFD